MNAFMYGFVDELEKLAVAGTPLGRQWEKKDPRRKKVARNLRDLREKGISAYGPTLRERLQGWKRYTLPPSERRQAARGELTALRAEAQKRGT